MFMERLGLFSFIVTLGVAMDEDKSFTTFLIIIGCSIGCSLCVLACFLLYVCHISMRSWKFFKYTLKLGLPICFIITVFSVNFYYLYVI